MSRQETSKAAEQSVADDTARLRRLVMNAVKGRGKHGATCDELEVLFHLRHQTASARLRELFLMNRVKDSGERRLTRSQRKAIVWVAR